VRLITNTIICLLALLAVICLYVFRQESFSGMQRTLAAALGREHPRTAKRDPVVPKPAPAKPERVAKAVRKIPEVEVVVVVPDVKSAPTTDAIEVGMEKASLAENYGPPEVRTSFLDGERFLETYVYLPNAAKATVVRLVNGRVSSVRNTRTISPPLLVPPSSHTQRVLFETYSR
jgi:hypothetical protein